MFLPWSLITGRPKTAKNTPSESKQRKPLRRPQMKIEALEDRVVPANYFVDASFAGASTGSLVSPFKTIQDALNAANANPGSDNVFVYGNNSTDPATASYVWERDGDANGDFLLDGNLDVGTDASNPVNLFMRASVRNVASADGSGGAAANLIVKMRDNIVDVRDNSQLRLEGTNDAARVIFTSVFDDSVGGDSLGDGDTNSAQRTDWGGIRYRAEAIDQGATSATGSLINFADIRYTGATVFDETVGFNTEFGSVRMEANSTNPSNVRSAQVRVWNTTFQHGGRALDVNINALGRGGKASSLITGPDLGAATAQGLRFVDNTINGAFIFIPADTFTGFLQQLYVNSTLDDVGVPYVITSRFVIGSARTTPGLAIPQGTVTLTFNEGIVFKSQNTGLDGIDFGEVNDATYGTIRVNGSVNRPVLFTSLSDDDLVANTDLAALYNNGSADTNNDGNATSATPGDWGGIRIAQGNIDHATVRFGGGFAQVNGTFVNWPAIRVFARDLTPAGLNVQQVRISNTEVTNTFSQLDATNPSFFADSPAIDLFSRDDGDTRFAGPFSPITRTGDVQVMDNNIHDNAGKAIQAHPLYFHDSRNTSGGYGVYFRRNILQNNSVNGVFVDFILDLARGIDQNLPSAGGVWDDTDIVTVFEGQALIVKPDQYFAMMSRRTVVPDSSSGGYLQKFTDASTFISSLVLRLPGNNPTNLTQPLNIPLQRGPLAVNTGLVDSGLFYYQTNFDSTSRNVTNSNGTLQRGEEWRDWGVNFVYAGEAGNINDPLRPFRTVTDPSNPAGVMLQTDTLDGDGSYEMVFPNGVSSVGFWIVNNQSNSPTNRIELIGANGQVIETAPMPTTAANGRTFFGRISRTAIYKVRIIDEAGDSTAAASNFGGAFNVAIPDNGTNAEALINVGSSFNISDVRVNLTITHARASDLTLELVAPDGTVVSLASRTGGTAAGANYTNTQFSDSFSTPITAGVAPFSGNFYPVSFDPFSANPTGLSVLNGKNSAGTWRLRVRDNATGSTGTINNFNITFQGAGLPLNNPGITGLTWVEAGENLVTKANSATSVITAGSIARGFAGVTQDFSGVITDGFTPQMYNVANGANAQGQFTFGRNTQTSFQMSTPTVLQPGGDTIIPLDIPATSNFVASDLTVNLNLNYAGNNSALRIRLRAPDGTEIDLVSQNSTTGTGGFTNTTFDDLSQPALNSINPNTGVAFTAPYTGTFQSRSFSQTVLTAPTTTTPFGLGFYKGKNVSGTWALVVTRSDAAAGTVNNFRLSFRAPVQGWGSTLRILGQGANPVLMTGIDDDTAGAGPIGNVVLDTANDGPTAASGGQWRGVQILAGVNTSVSEVVSQNPNGTLNRRYSDLNPYTRWDEGLYYPGINNPNNVLLSTQDRLQTSLAANNAGTTTAGRAPFDSFTTANLQDGTLVEFAEIRFATTGIDQRAYPKNKLTIDGNEFEQNAAPNGSVPGGAEIIQPVPAFQINQFDQVRFGTQDGTYTVGGRLGGSGDGPATDDVDWYELPSNTPEGRTLQLYVDVELGRRVAGVDEPNNRPVSIAVFNHEFQLLYWSGLGGGTGYADNVGLSGNTLGPIVIQNTDVPYTQDNGFQRDAKYIAVMPADRVPRSFIPTTASPAGLQPDQTTYVMNPFQSDRMSTSASADGGALFLLNQQGTIQVVTGDSIWDPSGPSGTTIGGYEMNLRFSGFERHLNPQQPADGQILIRSNTILNSSGDGISLSDVRMTMSNTALGATMPLQAARFNSFAINQSTNSTNNPYSNLDINNVNPSLSAPANFVPGPTIQNNLIINNGGNGITLREDRSTNAISQGNRLTPTAFTQISNNTIDNNNGAGIQLITRGGPTVQNNIVSNNTVGLNIVDGYDINNLTPAVTPVVSYNIFFANNTATSGNPYNGTQNIIGNGTAADPQYIDPNTLDYRVRLASPAVDSAVSDLQDRLRNTRFPQEPTRAPNIDLRGRSRIDNPSRPNVGSGAFPFYDRGALETNELSLRVIGLSVLADNNILGAPISSINIVFSGRVDLTTFTSSSVSLRIGTATGTVVPINFALMQNTYDKNSDTHTFTLPLFNQLNDGTYVLVMNGTTTGVGVKDIAGQLLDGEFPAPYNLPSGNGAAGGTFQYPFTIRTGAISGNVWRNDNGNGTIDSGEPGIGSVTVRLNGPGDDGVLFTGDDVVLATQVTTTAGAYNFSNVASGRYYVNVVQSSLPLNYRLNTPPADKVVNLGIGGIRSNVNFGYWLDSGNATVTGNIFSDLNGNGIFNPGEPAVVPSGGVTVTLTSGGADFDLSTAADNVVYTAITTPSGTYSFIGVTNNQIFGNNYRLDVDESTIPTSFVRTSPLIVPVTFFLLPGGSRVQNYGYQEKQAVIDGTVFNDADGSGTLNGGEVGIFNVTVRLLGAGIDGLFGTADDLPTQTTTTDAGGLYSFAPLTAGTYRVVVDSASPVLNNYFLTTGNSTQDLTLASGNGTTTAANVGYRLDPFTNQITGLVFNDLNGNAVYDLGEPGFGGVNVQLRWAGRNNVIGDSDDQVYNVVTDGAGAYTATNLPIGTFYVTPTTGVPAGFGPTGPATIPSIITLGYGQNYPGGSLSFFGYQPANSSINGVVFNDLNGDGVLDIGETGRFGGTRVYIDSNSNNIYDLGEQNAISNAGTGAYTISNLSANAGYRVRIDTLTSPVALPAGFVPSTGTIIVPVGPSQVVTSVDFGVQQRNAQVLGRVFIDLNNNGIFDAGEVGSPNQTITLTFTGSPTPSNFATTQFATTGSDGTYSFNGLPAGSYSVSTTVPTGGTIGSPGNPQAVNLSAGASGVLNFPVQFPGGGQTSGVWYFTFAGVNNVLTNSDGSQLVVSDTDIVRLTATDASTYNYSVFFRGSSFGLSSGTNEGIDAFTFTNSGQIIISTRGTHSVNTTFSSPGVGSGTAISGFGEDLLRFTPSAPNAGFGIQGGTWSRFFDGSRVGLSGASENVDAVSIIYNAAGTAIDRILLSTTGTALVSGGISANPQDVLAFKPTTQSSLGASTAGTYNKFFIGTSEGLTNPTLHNVDALFYQRDPVSPYSKPKLFISTSGNFTVSGGGANNDIAQFDATSGGPTGQLAGDFAATVALRGSSFGQGTANTTGFWQGTTVSDPNPFVVVVPGPLTVGSASASASSYVADSSAQVALALPATTSTSTAAKAVATSISSKTAQAVSTSNNAGKVVAEQADSFFANSKRTRSSAVASLAKNLLARFK